MYKIFPQRESRRGWIECEPHKATAFAVKLVTSRRRFGRTFLTVKMHTRYPNMKLAQTAMDCLNRGLTAAPKYTLGKRMGKRAEI